MSQSSTGPPAGLRRGIRVESALRTTPPNGSTWAARRPRTPPPPVLAGPRSIGSRPCWRRGSWRSTGAPVGPRRDADRLHSGARCQVPDGGGEGLNQVGLGVVREGIGGDDHGVDGRHGLVDTLPREVGGLRRGTSVGAGRSDDGDPFGNASSCTVTPAQRSLPPARDFKPIWDPCDCRRSVMVDIDSALMRGRRHGGGRSTAARAQIVVI